MANLEIKIENILIFLYRLSEFAAIFFFLAYDRSYEVWKGQENALKQGKHGETINLNIKIW